MAGLQAITGEVDGGEVQRVSDRTIDALVGHRPADTRARHYAPPPGKALAAAVGLVPLINLGVKGSAEVGEEGNVVPGPW